MSVSTMLLYTLLAICLSLFHGSHSSQGELQSLTKAGYDQLGSAPGIQVIHFHGARRISAEVDLESEIPDHTANEDRAVRMFYVQYKKAVAALAPYDVQLYIVNCEKEDIKDYCTKDKVHTNVYIFRQGSELLSLGLDSMFDVDAIVSNILQITLLREVPILQSQREREEYENQYKGYHDIIFSFQVAIGTKDHRLLMEVAHEYKDRYKWAITTEKKTTDGLPDIPVDDDTAAIWLLRCKDSPMTMTLAMKSCPSVAYQSKMTRRQVSEFLDNIPVSKVHVLDEGVISAPPFTSGLANVLIFIDDTEHEFVTESANEILSTFRGSIDMFIVNEKKVDAAMLSILTGRHIPCLAIQLSQDSELVFMSEDEEPDNFIKNQLNKMSGKGGDGQNVHRLESMDDDDEGYGSEAEEDEYSKYLSEVERQDDEVAMAMARFRGQITNDDSLLALTDKTFPTETTDRDLLLVLFYLPFDAMSSAVHRSFVMAADTLVKKNMSNPLSAVNCFDWTDVCGREKVTTWPTLRVYKKGQEMRTHKMVISPENIIYAISLFEIDAPVELESFQQLMKPMREVPPGTDRKLDVVILGLAENEYDQDTKLITDAALALHGTHIVYLAVGEVAKEIEEKTQTPKSMMLVARKGDQYLSHSKAPLKDFESTEHLVRWVKESAIFIYAELTPTNLPVIFGRKIPVVIFFTNAPNPGPYEGTHDLLGKIGGSQKLKNFVFTFMDKFEDRTKKVMMSYVGDSTDDVLTVLDHIKGHVYVYEGDLLSQPSMETWLKAIEAGEVTHKTTLPKGDWKPKVAPYDFLQMMDDDKRREKQENRDDNQMSHDLGDEEDLDGSDIGKADGSMSDESQFSDFEPVEYRTHPDLNDDLYMPPDDLELFKEKYGLGRDSFTLTDEQYEDFQSIVKERREERMNENEKKKKEKMEKMEKMKNKNRVEL